MRVSHWTTSLLLGCIATPLMAQTLPTTGVRTVPTYEAAGIYWSSPGAGAAGCEVKFRKLGDTEWRDGLVLWYDAAASECRGSLVSLAAGTTYEVQLNLPGQAPAAATTFSTWANQAPILKTIAVAPGSATLDITEGGSASGYVVYDGGGAALDANNAAPFNVTVNASYVIVRNLVLKGAQQDAIRISPNVSDVIIEDNDVSGWGRTRDGVWGTDMDSAIRAVCSTQTLSRVTIQRNRLHDPRWSANSWSDGHPAGPQGITFSYCGGNHVIRWNEIYSTAGNHFNDGMGGEDNFSTSGFPNRDSDIYGNRISQAWDDGIEAEGGNNNVRIWGNYLDSTATGIATTITSVGPVYLFRNVFNRNRFYEKSTCDADERQPMFKSGSSSSFRNGRRYLLHNTMLQASANGCSYGMGGGAGVGGTGDTQLVHNTISMNNIYHLWKPNSAVYQVGTDNTFQNDMFNGRMDTAVVSGINATPVYAAGNGWQSEASGQYQLAPGTPGFDGGVRIANFNDDFLGLAPDVGAAEGGAAAMLFGVAASTYTPATTPIAPPPPPPPPAPPVIGTASASATMDSSSYTSVAGTSVTFTVAIVGNNGTATGTVAFSDNGAAIAGCASVPLADGKALCSTASLAAGAHAISGAYSGDATYAAAVAGPVTQTVTAPPPAIGTLPVTATMDSTSYTIGAGTSVTFTAMVSGSSATPTGTIAFKDNGVLVAGCESVAVASGQALCSTNTLLAGSHKITGAYSGDATYGPGVAGPITQTVTAPVTLPTYFGMDASAYTIHRSDAVTFTAYIPGAGGSVSFSDNNASIAGCGAVPVPANGIAKCTTRKLAVGSHAIRGVYSGTPAYSAGVAGPVTVTVLK